MVRRIIEILVERTTVEDGDVPVPAAGEPHRCAQPEHPTADDVDFGVWGDHFGLARLSLQLFNVSVSTVI